MALGPWVIIVLVVLGATRAQIVLLGDSMKRRLRCRAVWRRSNIVKLACRST